VHGKPGLEDMDGVLSRETGQLYRAESCERLIYALKPFDKFTDRRFLTRELGESCLSESGNAFGTSWLLRAGLARICFRGASDLSQRTSSRLIGEWV
jgi:hypothetical protein